MVNKRQRKYNKHTKIVYIQHIKRCLAYALKWKLHALKAFKKMKRKQNSLMTQ